MSFLYRLLLVSGLIAVAMSGYVQAGETRVTFINPGGTQSFWGDVSQTMTAAAADLNIDLEILNADRRPYYMEELLKVRLEQGDLPEYVILVNELQEGARLIKMLEGHPIKVIFLLNGLTRTQLETLDETAKKPIIGSIIPNNEQAGYEMAVSLVSHSRALMPDKERLRLLALTGDDSTPAALDRQSGMERAIAEYGDVDLIAAVPVNWSGETAYDRTRAFLGRTQIDMIWGANDDIALGASRAAVERGLEPGKNIALAGLNWSKPAMDAVRRGYLTMTHGGHFFAGAWVMVMLYDHHHNAADTTATNDVVFEMSAITPANVDLFLERLGDKDWDKIAFSRFSRVNTGLPLYDFSAEAILEAASN